MSKPDPDTSRSGDEKEQREIQTQTAPTTPGSAEGDDDVPPPEKGSPQG